MMQDDKNSYQLKNNGQEGLINKYRSTSQKQERIESGKS
jgi:hypothetical protein